MNNLIIIAITVVFFNPWLAGSFGGAIVNVQSTRYSRHFEKNGAVSVAYPICHIGCTDIYRIGRVVGDIYILLDLVVKLLVNGNAGG